MQTRKPLNPVLNQNHQSELKLTFGLCLACGKSMSNTYGYYTLEDGTVGNVCSGACDREQAKKPRYPSHTVH